MDEQLKRFINNDAMSSAVYDVLLKAYLKPKSHDDVHRLAASRIAIDLLNDAWQELQSYKVNRSEGKGPTQVGM